MIRMILVLMLPSTSFLLAQTGITGSAPVSLQEGPADCGGSCVTVDLFVDVTGLSGTGGEVGLNGFVLAFDLDRSDVFATANAGTTPISEWGFLATNRDLGNLTDRLVLVGAVADMAAPNQDYHVASLTLCGAAGDVTLTCVPSESSLGSRVVAGDGPGLIDISSPPPFTVPITETFPLLWGNGLDSWLMDAPAYDLVAPFGLIDVLDLVKLNNCGQP